MLSTARIRIGDRTTDVLTDTCDQIVDRFIAIFGHELRGRLAPLRNAAELLTYETADAPTQRRIAQIIDRQVGAMTRLIDDLQYVARARAGHLTMRCTAARLSEVIEQTLEIVRPMVTARSHTLDIQMSPEPIHLHCDVLWLSQALQNLIANAAKYTEEGGRIRVSIQRDGAHAVISVTDTGQGIAAEHIDEIFELYVQLNRERTSRSEDGFGIGLHLVRQVVEAHGGTIQAMSAGRNRGSTFTVRLPVEMFAARCATAATKDPLCARTDNLITQSNDERPSAPARVNYQVRDPESRDEPRKG